MKENNTNTTNFWASLLAGFLFLFSAIMMYSKGKELVYPILTSFAGVLMFIYAFTKTTCYEKE